MDFRVQSAIAELTPDRQKFFVTFSIEEGERYEGRTREYRIDAARSAREDVKRSLKISKVTGTTLTPSKVDRNAGRPDRYAWICVRRYSAAARSE